MRLFPFYVLPPSSQFPRSCKHFATIMEEPWNNEVSEQRYEEWSKARSSACFFNVYFNGNFDVRLKFLKQFLIYVNQGQIRDSGSVTWAMLNHRIRSERREYKYFFKIKFQADVYHIEQLRETCSVRYPSFYAFHDAMMQCVSDGYDVTMIDRRYGLIQRKIKHYLNGTTDNVSDVSDVPIEVERCSDDQLRAMYNEYFYRDKPFNTRRKITRSKKRPSVNKPTKTSGNIAKTAPKGPRAWVTGASRHVKVTKAAVKPIRPIGATKPNKPVEATKPVSEAIEASNAVDKVITDSSVSSKSSERLSRIQDMRNELQMKHDSLESSRESLAVQMDAKYAELKRMLGVQQAIVYRFMATWSPNGSSSM